VVCLFLQSSSQRAQDKPSTWIPKLNTLGYQEPLFAPSPSVQAVLATIRESEIHTFIQTKDLATYEDLDDDGEHAPMLLSTLDLSHWTAIMWVATEDKEKGLARLSQAHAVLGTLLDDDKKDLEEAKRNTRAVEIMLRANNPHENWRNDSSSSLSTTNLEDTSASPSVVYCDVTEKNRVAMSRHRHNVASRHYDGSRRCCYSGIN
jgi:hypothetical protein